MHELTVVGARLLTIIMDFPTIEEGTSASTPIFGAMVSLLNDARLNKNKAPLGFLVSTNIHFALGINLLLEPPFVQIVQFQSQGFQW
jgi:hypothetical protein